MTPTRALTILLSSLALCFVGCGTSHTSDDDGGSSEMDAGPGGGVDSGGTRRDAGRPPDDGGPRLDAGERPACAPMDAQRDPCPEALCDGPDRWYWNGDDCFVLDCGSCDGDDCDLGYLSQMECEADHASCEATLCDDTGGTWMWWAEECGHYVCGEPVPAICFAPFPVCDCGADEIFVEGVGCMFDVSCTMRPGGTEEELCRDSGGSWENICCHTECGDFCPLPCANPACNCGPGKVFNAERGCIFATQCFERSSGQSCVQGQSRCEDGTICCDSCGGAGCAGMPTCRAPVCSDIPEIDVCGNNRIAP